MIIYGEDIMIPCHYVQWIIMKELAKITTTVAHTYTCLHVYVYNMWQLGIHMCILLLYQTKK